LPPPNCRQAACNRGVGLLQMAPPAAVRLAGPKAAALVLASLVGVEARLGGGSDNSNSTALQQAATSVGARADDEGRVEAASLKNPFPRGSAGRGLAYWNNASLVQAQAAAVDLPPTEGYEYLATTTRYGNTCCASCGNLDTAKVVQGTEYFAVASAQAMQDEFAKGSCCWCGEAGHGTGLASGVAPMGCGTCAKGRFIQKKPYDSPMWGSGALFEKEIKIVVADICPHRDNEAWCPAHVGEVNQFGVKNHFDFAAPPAEFDNYFFAFTPEPCPAEVQQSLMSLSQCSLR